MRTHPKKRIEIVVEAPLVPRVTALLTEQGALGFTVMPAISGLGPDGPWSRDGQVGTVGQMQMILCILSTDRTDALLDALFPMLSRQIGFVTISDCEVVRPERF